MVGWSNNGREEYVGVLEGSNVVRWIWWKVGFGCECSVGVLL